MKCIYCENDFERLVDAIPMCSECITKKATPCETHGYHLMDCPTTHKIHTSSWQPDYLQFYKNNEETKQFFGFELEYEFFEDTYTYEELSNSIVAMDKDKHFWISEDGSLDCGWELKNHPMTYNYIVNSKEIKDLFTMISKATYDDMCGLHFHISRDSFTEDGIKNLDWFVNTFYLFMTDIGGRPLNEYCNKQDKTYSTWGKIIQNFFNMEHYNMVNLENKSTIELRFCVSTSNYKTFIKRLTFIKLLCDFCNQYQFDDFILNERKTYKRFVEYISQNGFVENKFGNFDYQGI